MAAVFRLAPLGLREEAGAGQQQTARGARLFAGRLPEDGIACGHEAHAVALPRRHVRQQQGAVQGLVEQAEAPAPVPHPAAAVQGQYDVLVPFLLIFPGDQPLQAGGGLPVDEPERVAHSLDRKSVV